MVELTARRAGTIADERAARRQLRAQIARLEAQLSDALISAFPYGPIDTAVPAPGGPHVLGLGELERVRDALAEVDAIWYIRGKVALLFEVDLLNVVFDGNACHSQPDFDDCLT